jgi:hypothetical protein
VPGQLFFVPYILLPISSRELVQTLALRERVAEGRVREVAPCALAALAGVLTPAENVSSLLSEN